MIKDLEQVTAELNALNERATNALTAVEGDPSKLEEVTKLVTEEIQPQIAVLSKERDEAVQREEVKAMASTLSDITSVIEDLKKPSGEFKMAQGEHSEEDIAAGKALPEGDPYEDGKFSIYNDIRLANRNVADARERLTKGFEGLNEEGKAMTEGTPSQGGYLVRPQVERQIVQAKELDNVLRGLCSRLNVNTNSIQLDQLALSTLAGWVAELAQKPETTSMSLATVTASVFTAAGLATISNQLLADSDPAVDSLVTADLAKRLVALEETAFISGSGSGQPLGILNTPGITATPLAGTTIPELLDAILDAIASVETNHGAPSAILMHPRTWTRILKSRDTDNAYFISPASGVQDPRTGQRGPVKTLWGYPVVTSNRVPTNLGGGTNESRVIVADFREALILDRQGITVDESKHVYFTTNQTVLRAEQRVGFTAARTPAAFNVVGGAGLAAG